MSSKNIILTGASRGIGLAIAKYLLNEKHRVFLVARSREPLEGLKKDFPGQVEFLAGDLGDFEVCLFLFIGFLKGVEGQDDVFDSQNAIKISSLIFLG
jgi:short-subunit dehydrogenase